MIMRFGGLFLREEEPDTLVITSNYSLLDFDKKLQLNPDNIVYTDKEKSETIALDKNSKVLITTDQSGGSRGGTPNTSSEVYIKNKEELCPLCDFHSFEAVNDLRKTGCYKLAEYIANMLKNKYDVEWEYRIGIDTPEKLKRSNKAVFLIILTLIVTFIIIYYRLKYDINHPK